MANNITNRLRFDQCSTERCREILEAIRIENIGFGSIDFNKIIPEPSFTSDQECINWRIKNWDTKWDAYGYKDGIKVLTSPSVVSVACFCLGLSIILKVEKPSKVSILYDFRCSS